MTQGDQTSARLGEVLLCDKSLGDEVRTDSGNCVNMMIIIIPKIMMIIIPNMMIIIIPKMMIIIIPKMMIIIIPKMMMIRIDKSFDHLLQNLPRAVTSTWRLSKQLPSTPLLGAFDNICFG